MSNPYVDHVNGNNQTIDIRDTECRGQLTNLAQSIANALGANNGIATLDSNGKLPVSQLPSDSDKLDTAVLTGITESSTVATRAYTESDRFFLEPTGEYCMATSAISIGETLVENTNYTVITLEGVVASILTMGDQLNTIKADKVSSATNGNLAGLNGSGNPTDSGISGDMTTTSVSGNPISIADLKSAQIALNPIITFEPIQAGSGTPSPSNVRAISGYDKIEVLSCQKNLFNPYGEYIGRYGTTTINVSFSNNTLSLTRSSSGDRFIEFLFKVEIGKSYRLTSSATIGFYVKYYTEKPTVAMMYDGSQASSNTVLTPTGSWLGIEFELGESTMSLTDLQLEEGSTATTYEPYHKTTDLSESLGQTVYGGTYEPRTGAFTVKYGIKDMGDVTWYLASNNIFYSETDIGAAKKDGVTSVCSCYLSVANVAGTGAMASNPDKSIALMDSSTAYNRIYVKETSYSDATAFKTAVTGQKLVYELATPFTIQLTPHEIALSQGYNYISTNGTSISLAYHNGELASLADVAQAGETINALGDALVSKINTDISSAVSGILAKVATKTKGVIPANSSITMGVGTGKTVSLNFARMYLLINSTNASRCVFWIGTQNTQVGNVDAMITPANLSATLSSGIVTFTNNTGYNLDYALYEFAI